MNILSISLFIDLLEPFLVEWGIVQTDLHIQCRKVTATSPEFLDNLTWQIGWCRRSVHGFSCYTQTLSIRNSCFLYLFFDQTPDTQLYIFAQWQNDMWALLLVCMHLTNLVCLLNVIWPSIAMFDTMFFSDIASIALITWGRNWNMEI